MVTIIMKQKKCLLALFLIFVLAAVLAGCSSPLETELSIDRGFSGKRVMTCSFTQSQLEPTGMTLSELLQNSCPDELSWSVEGTENGERCTLTLEFASQQEYLKKVTALLNAGTRRDPEYRRIPFVLYSTPDTILTSGCRIREDFTSADLLEWLIDAFDDASGRPSGIVFEFVRNEVITDGGQPVSVSKWIDLNSLNAEAVSRIEIETKQSEDSELFSRVVRIVFPKHTADALGNALTDFLRGNLPEGARSVWTEGDDSRTYTVVFPAADLDGLQTATRTFFRSDQAALQQTQLNESSSPTVDERAVEESIDLSGFFSEGESTDVFYSFTANEYTQLLQGSVYGTGEWIKSDKISDHRVFTYEGNEDVVRFRLVLSETHLIDSIDVAMLQNDDGTFTREMAFCFDAQKSHNGAAYCERYFNTINSTAAAAAVSKRGEQEICTLSMRGTAVELTEICSRLFGEKNVISFAETQSTFSLKNYLLFRDDIVLAQHLGETNSPTPLRYTLALNEEEAKRFPLLEYSEYGRQRRLKNPEQTGVFSFSVASAETRIAFDGSSYNVGGVIVLILLSLLVVALLVGLFLLLLRSGRDPWFDDPQHCRTAADEARRHREEVFRRREERNSRP
ncbi:MAG: hypothetical protein PUC59_01475 [Firmicutes bacterium]|nr:hypothetical protein [Bacillota bacterium]